MGRGTNENETQAAKSRTKTFKPVVNQILQRHHGADGVSHDEHELRYLRPKEFEVPQTLADLPFVGTKRNPHRDWYYDVKGGALREHDTSLRVRRRADGSLTVTFKVKLATDKERTLRREVEHRLICPTCDQTGCAICREPTALLEAAQGPAIDAARAVVGRKAKFAHMFTVVNDRTDHHYDNGEGRHMVLSEDNITYPDGSNEQRIEVEHVDGPLKLIDRAHKQLSETYSKIKYAPRGKQREARERLAKLLDV